MEENRRAIALYRVSTKKQLSLEEDIPVQQKAVREFIWKNNWNLVREFTEGGVSGYKVSAKNRDALQTIKNMATKKEFDILVVFMSDRLGRIADETPVVVNTLNKLGVEIYSVLEGKIGGDNHIDKLITYVKFWQNEGESIKTSERVKEALKQKIENGQFKGGTPPFGYKLVNNGSVNYKGRQILDLVIDEYESEVVKLIYDLSINKNFGQRRICEYLNSNGYKTRKGGHFAISTIQNVLNNPIYMGKLMLHKSDNENRIEHIDIIQDYVIIPKDQWELNQHILNRRTINRNPELTVIDRRKDKKYPDHIHNHGKLLLNGFIYCGYCGCELTTLTATNRWSRADGTSMRKRYYKYRCSSVYKNVECEGQSTYGRVKIEEITKKYVVDWMNKLKRQDLKEMIEQLKNEENKQLNQLEIKLKNSIEQQYKELQILKNEITKSLMGQSSFKPEILQQLIDEKNENIKTTEAELINIENSIKNKEIEKINLIKLNDYIMNWNDIFEHADFDTQKAMLSKVVDRVTVYKDNIKVKLNLNVQELWGELGSKSECDASMMRYLIHLINNRYSQDTIVNF